MKLFGYALTCQQPEGREGKKVSLKSLLQSMGSLRVIHIVDSEDGFLYKSSRGERAGRRLAVRPAGRRPGAGRCRPVTARIRVSISGQAAIIPKGFRYQRPGGLTRFEGQQRAKRSEAGMKIALIHDYQPNLGGTTEVVIRMARALARRGHSCKLITHPESWVRERDKENLELVRASMAKITFMQYVPHDCVKVAKIVSLYKNDHIDLCHAHYALPYGLVGYLAKQTCGVPYIVTLHGTDVHTLASMPSLKPVMRLCLERADAVTSVCEYLKAGALRKLEMARTVEAIPNFVNARRFRPRPVSGALRQELNVPKGYSVVTHISNYATIKNTLIIPEIARLVLQKHRQIIFLMVGEALGEEGFDLEGLKKKVRELGLDAHFRFVGRRRDVPEILSLSEMSLLTSLNEGAPLAVLESLAVGVPVVSSRVGGIPELIRHGVHGCLVEGQRTEKYADYISGLIEYPRLRHKLGRNGVALVHEKYREEVVISQYLRLYESVLGRPRDEGMPAMRRESAV